MSARGASVLRLVQQATLVALVVWVAVHTVLVWRTGWTSWRLGGLGMYAQPSLEYRAAAVVVCDSETCARERSDRRHFAPELNYAVPLIEPTPGGQAPYRLVGTRKSGIPAALGSFRRMPTRGHAKSLVEAWLATPCGPYLVVFYQQNVSMITKRANVTSRPFVVSFPSERCTREDRID